MANFLLKLKLVIWKNYIIRKRHWLLTIFEILMSVLIFLLLAYVKKEIPEFNKEYINTTTYHDVQLLKPPIVDILYAPDRPEIHAFMERINERTISREFRGFSSEHEMLAYVSNLNKTQSYDEPNLVGIVFDNFPQANKAGKLKYRLRTDMSSQFESLFPLYERPFQSYAKTRYMDSGFIGVQYVVDRAYIDMLSKNKQPFEITMQQMPYPPYTDMRGVSDYFLTVLPFCTILAFILMFPSVLKRVIEEKSTGIKELMKMMGLESWMLWLGWFLHSMVTNIVAIIFIVLMLKVGLSSETTSIIEYGSGSVLLVFLFLYVTSAICFSFAISTIFKKPTLGMCVGMLVWMVSFFVVSPLVSNDDPTAYLCLRKFIMLLPNVCVVYGFNAFSVFESKETGLTWSTLTSKPNPYTPHPSMALVFVMFIVDSILFLTLTWYIDSVYPGEYGIARPWYFPFTKSYWCTNKVDSTDPSLEQLQSSDEVEAVPTDLIPGVQIRNLHKVFNGKRAVNGLNLDIYTNQITVLLGHNGAGKTTTMNIITGMMAPSSGSVVVDGYSIQVNLNKVRESLGLCPQHNLHFSDLTVLEHLIFFAMLKGSSKNKATEEAHSFLARLNLSAKANKMASELSGGMKRKLSLGMALVGRTRVLMLDEPTSGMDPEARREIWDFLLSLRGERTILITTHYMEEADILGDRIAIMHYGQLQCYGTSLFLKNHYGTGYTLSILVAPSWDVNTISAAIHGYVPSATVKSISAGCVVFVLPTNDTTALSKLFLSLEQNKSELGIKNFGVSITTMEDVFLRVGELAEVHDKTVSKQSDSDSTKYLLTDNYSEDPQKDKITSPYILVWHQFLALLFKRVQYTIHRWLLFLLQLLIPIAMMLFIMTIMKMEGLRSETEVKRELTLNSYAKAETFYSTTKNTVKLGDYYSRVVRSQHATATKVTDVSEAIVANGVVDLERYHRSFITAAELNDTVTASGTFTLNAMYGDWALHGPPTSLNLITNALLKYLMKNENYAISVTNNPWPITHDSTVDFNIAAVLMWSFQFPVAFTIMIGMFLIFPQEERLSGVKHLQLMTGLPRAMYWLANYLFDLVVYIVIGVLIVFIVLSFDSDGPFGNPSALQALCSLMFLYGFAALPFSYLFTYRPTASSSMTVLIWIQILAGTIATTVVGVLEHLGPDYATTRDGIAYTMFFIPNFAFSHGIYRFSLHTSEIYRWKNMEYSQKKYQCTYTHPSPCCDPNSLECAEFYSYFKGDYSIERNILYLLFHIVLYSVLLLFIDSGIPRKYIEMLFDMRKDKESVDGTLDEDVADEKRRVDAQINEKVQLLSVNNIHGTEAADVLQVSNLRKWFMSFYAVRGLNFGVKSSECFGLLGVNGAGKTTTFKMLTGEIFPSVGISHLLGFSVAGDKLSYMKKIGYCPQFDALNLTLTTRQMLVLFAKLRGIPSHNVNKHVNKWISKFGIKEYENIPCGKLSGGNKRKLNTAIALIGDPPLIMLDEPTSGVDPVARRNLWDILAVLRKSGQSIVLTSHSMDECEALCDRLAIMVDGQMKCIGNIQYLKNKFGQGFTVMLKLRATATTGDALDGPSELNQLKEEMEHKYSCILKDEHTGMLLYHVTNPDASLGEIFHFMESLKGKKDILEDYTVSDTSLEQVFLSFAKEKDSTAPAVNVTAAGIV
ncbi:ATP binding cassette subfamily A member 3 [Carabus blaptoides fortunei]